MSHNPTIDGHSGWCSIGGLARPLRHGLVAVSTTMCRLITALEHLARYQSPVLILGESGTGKRAIAEVLHALGEHPDAPLIKFDCGDLVNANAAPQLFGVAIPSFGATAIRPGCFQLASGGSLLLERVGTLPFELQGKLLRAVESLEVQPAGSAMAIHADVRLIASADHDLPAMVRTGRFRPDLFYRLAAASLTVPALRDRRADLEPLIAEAIASHNRLLGTGVYAISAVALGHLRAYQWPGNLRELSRAIERAILVCEDDRVDAADLPSAISGNYPQPMPSDSPASIGARPANTRNQAALEGRRRGSAPLRDRGAAGPKSYSRWNLDDALREAIEQALVAACGDDVKAAAMLGVSRAALYKKMIRYGLTVPNQMRSRD